MKHKSYGPNLAIGQSIYFFEPSNIAIKVSVCWSVVGVSWVREKCVLLSQKIVRTNPELLGFFSVGSYTSIINNYPSGSSACRYHAKEIKEDERVGKKCPFRFRVQKGQT
jgi:hypothetical protein